MSARTTIQLDSFELTGLPAGSGDPAKLTAGGQDWLPAQVPGGVHESLIAAGRIEHPFYGSNERRDAWIDQQEWWYRSTFSVPDAARSPNAVPSPKAVRSPNTVQEPDAGQSPAAVQVPGAVIATKAGGAFQASAPSEPGAGSQTDGIVQEGEHERVRLVFDGLDTVADLWLNGTFLGHHENQFRPAEFDITALLEPVNRLVIRFSPPLAGRRVPADLAETMAKLAAAFAELAPEADSTADAGDEEMFGPLGGPAVTIRKAPFSWGWDFGPNVPSIGIWRPVRLNLERGAILRGHHVAVTHLSADRGTAEVKLLAEVESFAAEPLLARFRLTAPSGRVFTADVPVGADGVAVTNIEVSSPELWWSHDLGAQPLHDLRIDLLESQDVTGARQCTDGTVQVLDSVEDKVGLRTIQIDRSADPEEGGRYFRFMLNGVPVFARGANWLPASNFVGSVTEADYDRWIELARHGNFNMLRVWGGGIYEHDAFYAACDRLGVLIWQDFIFACADYPSADPDLQREVTLEAEYQVKRLRKRACLAAWAGNNEIQSIHLVTGRNLDPGNWGWHFFHQILPAAVAKYDGLTHYSPSSPWSEGGTEAILTGTDGDRHTWEVWHGDVIPSGRTFPTKGDERHYRRYAEDHSKFVSEFGIHAAPDLDTLRRWIGEADLWIHSPVFDLHNKDNPKNKGDELLAVTTGLPDGIEQYVAFTQAVQAEGMAFAIQHYRRRQPHCAGALMWQFNDVWPGFSWSVVDHDGVPKAAYYAAKRACAAVAVSVADRADGGLELWLVNNGPRSVEDVAMDVELGRFGGGDEVRSRVRGSAPTGGAVLIWSLDAAQVPRDTRHYAWATNPDGLFPPARHYFAEIGQLELGPGRLDVSVVEEGLRIASAGHAYCVRISQPVPDLRLSDNCFDLRAGDELMVEVSGIDPAALTVTLPFQ
jgi:beta-mannosidase